MKEERSGGDLHEKGREVILVCHSRLKDENDEAIVEAKSIVEGGELAIDKHELSETQGGVKRPQVTGASTQ